MERELMDARDDVLAVERRLAEAVLARDRAAADAVLDPAFSATGHAGNDVDRTQYLNIHFAPEREFTRFDTERQQLFAVGDGIVVTGQVTMINARLAQNPPPARYVAVYVPTPNGGWRIRYWQETPIDDSLRF